MANTNCFSDTDISGLAPAACNVAASGLWALKPMDYLYCYLVLTTIWSWSKQDHDKR